MKVVRYAVLAVAAATAAHAQTTIYKHVDESGHVTYSNKPMKGATVLDLEPLTVIQTPPPQAKARPAIEKAEPAAKAEPKAAMASLEVAAPLASVASVDPQLQKRRDNDRRRILEDEMQTEEEALARAREALTQEQQNPTLVAAVRAAQQASEPTIAQLAEFRSSIDKASGRIRGLQSTVAEHEKNIEALKKELGALKP